MEHTDGLRILRLDKNAVIPARATDGSAGVDLCACIASPVKIGPGENRVIKTGIAVGLPAGAYVGLVFARSGLAVKHGIALSNGVGVIDGDYTGEICVGLINQSGTPYEISPGERIAQLVVAPVCMLPVTEVGSLNETGRGAGCFGSTGQF